MTMLALGQRTGRDGRGRTRHCIKILAQLDKSSGPCRFDVLIPVAARNMLLNRLRAETRPAHNRIERDLRLTERTASRQLYRALVTRFYGFHAAWEAKAEAVIGDPDLFRGRRKTPLLVKDLRALGATADEIAALPRCWPLVPMSTRAAALGSMYVVEGSTLGGALIARQIERALGLGPETGCAYFHSYGRDVGRMWKAFGTRLAAASGPDDDRIVAAANETFECLRLWLCEERRAA